MTIFLKISRTLNNLIVSVLSDAIEEMLVILIICNNEIKIK